jgi:CBS-domain-containing membrane protein
VIHEIQMNSRRQIINAIVGAAGGAVAIAFMVLISERAGMPLQFIPFATSIVLVMGSPDQEPAQPRALVGGHLISTVIGLVLVALTGPSPWAAACSVGLSMVAMHATRTFHPPAGIDPLIAVYYGKPWGFFLAPVAVGVGLLVVFAFAWHNAFQRGSWPRRWW